LVLDLKFLYANAEKFNNHTISLDLQSPSDHILLLICTIIKKEFIKEKKKAIVKNSKEEREFVNELRNRISCISILNIINQEMLEELTQDFAFTMKEL